jgi:hypothetical protein
MQAFDVQKCLVEVRGAETADLLDRITAYRAGMEPRAIELIEQELRDRGVAQAEIDAHAEACRQSCLFDVTGTALACSCCRRPAVAEVWGWHRLWGVVPLFPSKRRYCRIHFHGYSGSESPV